jgi:hypothetical protein
MFVHRTSQPSASIIGHQKQMNDAPLANAEKQHGFDFYARYCETIASVYGADKCPSREKWDAMCREPRTVRKFTDEEFDRNQFSEENGDGEIYG